MWASIPLLVGCGGGREASSGNLFFQLLPTVTHLLAVCCCEEPGSVLSATRLVIWVTPAEFAPVNQHVSCLGAPKTRSNVSVWSASCWPRGCSCGPACCWPPLLPGQAAGSCRARCLPGPTLTRCGCPYAQAWHHTIAVGWTFHKRFFFFPFCDGFWLWQGRSCIWAGLGTKT